MVKNENTYLIRNEDVIFANDLLLKGKSQKIPDEILYIL